MRGNMNYNQQQWGQPQMGMGVNYSNQRRTPDFTQPLDPEIIRKMKGGHNKSFTTKITAEEQHRAICTHKDPDKGNDFSLIDEDDGTVTCYICGANFELADYTMEEVRTAVQNVLDIMQNIKTVYVDIPMNVATEYMTMGVFLEKLPELYQIAYTNFDSYDRSMHHGQQQNAFGMFNAMTNPGFMQQQPMMGGGFGQPQPQYAGGNPFGYQGGYDQQQMNQQQMMQQQQQPGYAPQPQQQQKDGKKGKSQQMQGNPNQVNVPNFQGQPVDFQPQTFQV